jgi:predicted AlkP superfamily pyrophosphatase or phosphodiesterase
MVKGRHPMYFQDRYNSKITSKERLFQGLVWLKEYRPSFISIYLSDLDGVGHSTGTHSAAINETLARIDAELGEFYEKLKSEPNVHLLIVSDHGMSTIMDSRRYDLEDMLDMSQVLHYDVGGFVTIWPRTGNRKSFILN